MSPRYKIVSVLILGLMFVAARPSTQAAGYLQATDVATQSGVATQPPGTVSKILFRATLYDADGKNPVTVSKEAHPGLAVLSPDGKSIAYSKIDGIYVSDVSGANLHLITKTAISPQTGYPEWSPDSKQILFVSVFDAPQDSMSGVYIVNADGSSPEQQVKLDTPVTFTENSWTEDPAWLPDGQHIGFTASTGDKSGYFVANVDGSKVTPLDFDGSGFDNPRWSPDSQHFLHVNSDGKIAINSADGTNSQTLNMSLGNVRFGQAVWSPDGTQIAVTGTDGAAQHLYVMNADGSNVTAVADLTDYNPSVALTWAYVPATSLKPGVPPTRTPFPSRTPAPTRTPFPSRTAKPTRTPFPSRTPKPTVTPKS